MLLSTNQNGAATDLYVSPNGSDTQDGSLIHPFRTLSRARETVRAINQTVSQDIHVNLRGGIYPLEQPIVFSAADSGFNGFKVVYQAYGSEQPIISGGVPITGWKLDHDHIYQAKLNYDRKLRNLYVNGVRAKMTSKKIKGLGPWGTFVVQGSEPWAETAGKTMDGVLCDPLFPTPPRNPCDIELFQARVFSFPILCLRNIFEENGKNVLQFQQPSGAIASTMAWHCNIDPNGAFILRNAFELLKGPGEFYFNRATHTVYYYAHDGEDLNSETVVAPTSEGLLRLSGTSTNDRLRNLEFSGLTFSNDNWLLEQIADSSGVIGVQSLGLYTKFRSDGNHHKTHYNILDLPQGSIELRNCSHIKFERNHFAQLGSGCAINLVNDVVDCSIIGNTFRSLSGNAINIGHPQHYIIGDGPLYPQGIEGVCARDVISNNFMREVCLEFEQFEAISGFFTEGIHICHNDIAGVPYGGIALGWGWGDANIPFSNVSKNNVIAYNRIIDTQQKLAGDGGAIYVLGHQPGGRIEKNYIRSGTRLIYPDDGSTGWTISENVLDVKWGTWINLWTDRCHDMEITDNYSNTQSVNNHGKNTPLKNTHIEKGEWSSDARAVMDGAGLEKPYQDLATVGTGS